MNLNVRRCVPVFFIFIASPPSLGVGCDGEAIRHARHTRSAPKLTASLWAASEEFEIRRQRRYAVQCCQAKSPQFIDATGAQDNARAVDLLKDRWTADVRVLNDVDRGWPAVVAIPTMTAISIEVV